LGFAAVGFGVLLIGLTLVLTTPTFDVFTVSSTVDGFVQDVDTNAFLAGATISANIDTFDSQARPWNQQKEAVTDAAGYYAISFPCGQGFSFTIDMDVSLPGYYPVSRSFTGTCGQSYGQNFKMQAVPADAPAEDPPPPDQPVEQPKGPTPTTTVEETVAEAEADASRLTTVAFVLVAIGIAFVMMAFVPLLAWRSLRGDEDASAIATAVLLPLGLLIGTWIAVATRFSADVWVSLLIFVVVFILAVMTWVFMRMVSALFAFATVVSLGHLAATWFWTAL
jgi:hypothetical protein